MNRIALRSTARSMAGTTAFRAEEQSAQKSWWMPAVFVSLAILFMGAVFAAGVSIRASYTLANLQQRREVALHQQQVLQEQLAEVTSLAYTEQYAVEAGFTGTVTPVAELNLTTPVAQR